MSKRVAVIDDSELSLAATRGALEAIGCDVVLMSEPRRELLVGAGAPNLVLLDVNMPQSFGDDVVGFLREAWGMSAPIVLFSGLPELELERRARQSRADGYVCKDWGPERLVATVRRLLGTTKDPDRESGVRALYREFARRCEDRAQHIASQVLDASRDPTAALRVISLDIHDWQGEAKLLGLDKLAEVVEEVDRLVRSWGQRFSPSTQGTQLSAWAVRLAEVSRRLALEPPSSAASQELQLLRQDIRVEVDSLAPRTQCATPFPGVRNVGRRMLIFDDSPIVGEALSLELEARGHQAAIASGLDDFELKLAEFKPEVIILDINMPEIRGDELCRRLRWKLGLPIIFLSSLPEAELAVLAGRAGASGYLSKQRGADELVKYLDELLKDVIF